MAGNWFQILSLDGGGIKGLFSAAVLAAIEDDLGIRIVDHFDLITGTSTGGLIALNLGAGMRPRDIVEFYVSKGPQIFRRTWGWHLLKHWFCRKYRPAAITAALKQCLGDKCLAHSVKRLVIPAYNLDANDVYLFKTPHHPKLVRDYRVPMWKVALATCAAPTFFPACTAVDHIPLIDGGVWANNPAMVGVAEAKSFLGVPLDNIRVLSIGTSEDVVDRPKRLYWGGRLVWATHAIQVILHGQSLAVGNLATHLLGPERIVRLNPKVPRGKFTIDKLRLDTLQGLAASFSRPYSTQFAETFGSQIAPEYKPMHTC